MSKKFYITIIIACVFLSTGMVFLYSKSTDEKMGNSGDLLEEVHKPEEKKPNTEEKIENPKQEFSLLAVGDIMLDRSVLLKTQAAKDWNHPFHLIDPLLSQYDVRLANLEGPITTNKSISNGTGGNRFFFTFSPNFIEPLKKRFDIFSLANNHALNFKQDGLEQTRNYLSEAGITYFGGPDNTLDFVATTTEKNGITIGWIGYHQLVEKNFENIISEIKRLHSEVDLVIVMPHWGTEYVTEKPTYLQTKEAHEMIDAGAGLILGAHPHVVEPIEIYKDKVIFYSLGNFIFDQYFSEETMTGLAVGMDITKEEGKIDLDYTLIPLDINTLSQPSVADETKKKKLLQQIAKDSNVEENVRKEMKEGRISQE